MLGNFYRLTFPRLRVAWIYVGSAVSSLGYSCVTGDGACPNYTIGGVGMVFLYIGITDMWKILSIFFGDTAWSLLIGYMGGAGCGFCNAWITYWGSAIAALSEEVFGGSMRVGDQTNMLVIFSAEVSLM